MHMLMWHVSKCNVHSEVHSEIQLNCTIYHVPYRHTTTHPQQRSPVGDILEEQNMQIRRGFYETTHPIKRK